MTGGRHDTSWGLRRFVGRTGEAELLQAAAKSVGMEPEDGGRPTRPADDPVRLPQDRQDVGPLHVFDRRGRLAGLLSRGLANNVEVDFERGASREDDRALEDVLKFADVARPRVSHESAQGARVDPLEPPPDPRRENVEEETRQ